MKDPRARHKAKPQPPTRRCHRCRGAGRVACPICSGKGQIQTGSTLTGGPIMDSCTGCYGAKTSRCSVCGGGGFVH